MSRRWRWIGGITVGLLSYGVGLLVTVPADIAWSYAADDAPARLHRPVGTVQSGSAEALSSGSLVIRDPDWSWQPGALLNADLAWALRGRLADGNLATTIRYGFSGPAADSLQADVAAADLALLLNKPEAADSLSGRVTADLEGIRFRGDRLIGASGMIRWRDAVLQRGGSVDLGDIDLTLDPDSGTEGVSGQLEARGGDIQLDGRLRLDPDGAFELSLQTGGEGETGGIAQQLRPLFGADGDDGPIVITGQLRADGLALRDNG